MGAMPGRGPSFVMNWTLSVVDREVSWQVAAVEGIDRVGERLPDFSLVRGPVRRRERRGEERRAKYENRAAVETSLRVLPWMTMTSCGPAAAAAAPVDAR